MRTHALPVSGQAAALVLTPDIQRLPTGLLPMGLIAESDLIRDRHGDGWRGTITLAVEGQYGAVSAYLTLLPGHARDLARKLTRQADFADARSKGREGPCLCTAWSHNLYDCPNEAALDYSMCRDCWTPEDGQSKLDMGHGGSNAQV